MDQKKSSAVKVPEKTAEKPIPRRSTPVAMNGVRTGEQFAELMSALMTDLITGSVTPQIVNATCNAGGKLLKVAEMQIKYGRRRPINLLDMSGS